MICIEMTQRDKIHGIRVEDKLRKYGFTQFTGMVRQHLDLLANSTIFELIPTRQDILTMQFKTDYKYPWQKRKEILFQKFK